MEAVASMVRKAAKRAMPDTKVVDDNGYPLVVYYGTTNGKFYVFDNSKGIERYYILRRKRDF